MSFSKLLSFIPEQLKKENTEKQLDVYRIILFLSASFPILLRQLFVEFHRIHYDPFNIKIGFTIVLSVTFFLTYVEYFKKNMTIIVLSLLFIYTQYLIYLVGRNDFEDDYILEFILFLVVSSRVFNTKNGLLTYFSFTFVTYSYTCFIYLDSHTELISYIGLILVFIISIGIFFESKIRVENQEGFRSILLHTVFNESIDAIFLVDPKDGLVKECNDVALTIFGFSVKESIIEKGIDRILSPYRLEPLLRDAQESKNGYFSECNFKKQDQSFFYGTIAYKKIKVDEIELVLLRISDITERVNYKKKIEENRKMLRKVIDLVPHEIFLKDSKSNFLFVNKIFLQNHNVKEEYVLGKSDYDIFDKETARKYIEDDQEVILSGNEKYIEAELFTDYKGEEHVLQITKMPFVSKDGEGPHLLGISIDVSERVHDKELIEENRKMLMQILNILPHNVYLKDKEGKFVLVNQNTASELNVDPGEMLGKTDWDFYPAAFAEKFEKDEQEILKGGIPKIIPEEESIDHKGVFKVKNVIKLPFLLNATNEIGLLAIDIDITESKLAEKALKESETKFKMLMEQASDGIYLSDQLGNIIEANPKAAEIFGYNLEEFLQLNIKKLIDPKDAKELVFKDSPYSIKESIIIERKFLKKDLESITVELSVRLLEDGRHQGILRDITERKKLEKVLKDNERKFRALIENSSDVIIIVSDKFTVKFISASVNRILGYDQDASLGKSLFDFIHPEATERISKIFLETLSDPGNKHVAEELMIRNSKGEFLCFEIVAVNLLSDPNINGIILNCHDITKRKSTETELLTTNFELDSFVYKASHDLKAPLRSVMGLIKLAQMESEDKSLNIYLDKMSKSVISLDVYIKDLTQFSRNSRQEIETKNIDFEKIIQESLNNLKYLDSTHKVTLRNCINSSFPFYSDYGRISTVINNLLSNAFKYYRQDISDPCITLSIWSQKENAVIEIEDNGIGISPLYINKIFDMFYRASEQSYGAGLGLYIVKSAVKKLQGTIEVESQLNVGTKFKIIIPNLIHKITKK